MECNKLNIPEHWHRNLDGSYDTGYQMLRNYMGQSIVSLFLFYSGYGIYEAIKRKGTAYIKAMPVKRMNITVRRSRQSGVARATCPD